jgi:5'(3')-deoxyribonucleotidase
MRGVPKESGTMSAVIAFDVDSVLFPINELCVLPYLRDAHGILMTKDQITAFDYGNKTIQKWAYEVFRRSDLYDGHLPDPDALAVLTDLRKRHRVIAVSSPFRGHASSKWAFCQRFGFDHEDIVLCGDKTLVGFDLLVDDRPRTLMEVGSRRALVFDQPWNRGELLWFDRIHGWGLSTTELIERKLAA